MYARSFPYWECIVHPYTILRSSSSLLSINICSFCTAFKNHSGAIISASLLNINTSTVTGFFLNHTVISLLRSICIPLPVNSMYIINQRFTGRSCLLFMLPYIVTIHCENCHDLFSVLCTVYS